jgi:hypothetical protein
MTVTTDGVTITLDGEPVILRFTLGAAKQLNNTFGNFVEALQRINKFDFEAFPAVIAAGLGKSSKDVEASVFSAGMDNLYKDLGTYLVWLSNGGREPTPVSAAAQSDAGNA